METKANYALVGFFTVLVMAAAFAFVYWMSQYGRGGEMAQLAVRIPGSANGLSSWRVNPPACSAGQNRFPGRAK